MRIIIRLSNVVSTWTWLWSAKTTYINSFC